MLWGSIIPKILWQTVRNFSDTSLMSLPKEIRYCWQEVQLSIRTWVYLIAENTMTRALDFNGDAMDIHDEYRIMKDHLLISAQFQTTVAPFKSLNYPSHSHTHRDFRKRSLEMVYDIALIQIGYLGKVQLETEITLKKFSMTFWIWENRYLVLRD